SLGALALEGGTNPRPLAIAFGVLTCETPQQAQERADPRGTDKGGEAALACVEHVHALRAAEADSAGSRTQARECALQALYPLDLSGADPRAPLRGRRPHF